MLQCRSGPHTIIESSVNQVGNINIDFNIMAPWRTELLIKPKSISTPTEINMRAQPAAVCVTLRLGRTIRSTKIEIETVGGGWSALRARPAGCIDLAALNAAFNAAGVAALVAVGVAALVVVGVAALVAVGVAALVAAGNAALVAVGVAAGINETKLNTDPLFGADIII